MQLCLFFSNVLIGIKTPLKGGNDNLVPCFRYIHLGEQEKPVWYTQSHVQPLSSTETTLGVSGPSSYRATVVYMVLLTTEGALKSKGQVSRGSPRLSCLPRGPDSAPL